MKIVLSIPSWKSLLWNSSLVADGRSLMFCFFENDGRADDLFIRG
jgi:hypothetical protein